MWMLRLLATILTRATRAITSSTRIFSLSIYSSMPIGGGHPPNQYRTDPSSRTWKKSCPAQYADPATPSTVTG